MTKEITKTATTATTKFTPDNPVRFVAEEQNLWGPGEALSYELSEYIPIIGGDRVDYRIDSLASSHGKAIADGDKIEWLPLDDFEDLVSGQTRQVIVTYTLAEEIQLEHGRIMTKQNGNRVVIEGDGTVTPVGPQIGQIETPEFRSITGALMNNAYIREIAKTEVIEVTGGGTLRFGTPGSDEKTIESHEFTAIDADDILKNSQQLADEKLIDIDIDLMRDVSEFFSQGAESIAAASNATETEANRILNNKFVLLDELMGHWAKRDAAAIEAEVWKPAASESVFDFVAHIGQPLTELVNLYERITNVYQSQLDEIPTAFKPDWWIKEQIDNRTAEYEYNLANEFTPEQLNYARAEADKAAAIADINATIAELRDNGEFRGHEPTVADVTVAMAELAALGATTELLDGVAAMADSAADIADTFRTDPNLKTNVDVDGELNFTGEAQVGAIIDFKISAGEVDANLDYQLDTTAIHDAATDEMTITALATSLETEDSKPFSTVGPYIEAFLGIAYDVEGFLDGFLDMDIDLLGHDIIDTRLDIDTSFSDVTSDEVGQSVSMSGIVPLIDFKSAETEIGVDIPIPSDLAEIMTEWRLQVPHIEAEGTTWSALTEDHPEITTKEDAIEHYLGNEPFFSVDKLASMFRELLDARPDFSEEFQQLLAENGHSTGLWDDEKPPLDAILTALAQSILDSEGEVIPIFAIDATGDNNEALFHVNTIADLTAEEKAGVGEIDFFVASSDKAPFYTATIDIDQLAAKVINSVLGNGSKVVLNPLDLEIGVDYLLRKGGVHEDTITKVTNIVDLGIQIEAADLEVSAAVSAQQDFALSIDEITYEVTFEDGHVETVAATSGDDIVLANASAHDANGDGHVDYTMTLTPDAQFFNDTEVVFSHGIQLDLLKAKLNAGLNIDGILEEMPALRDVPLLGDALAAMDVTPTEVNFGPLMRMAADFEGLSFDVFEDIFDFTFNELPSVSGSFALAGVEDKAPEPALVDEIVKIGGKGADALNGGLEDDLLKGRGGDDTLMGSYGEDTLIGGRGKDELHGQSDDDILRGKAGADLLMGHAGDDVLKGNAGADLLMGHAGDDVLKGNAGKDVLSGGVGDDVLSGGKGADIFQFRANGGTDVITDFKLDRDLIEITNGADSLDDLHFTQIGDDVEVGFGRTHILVEDLTITELQNLDNFAF